MADIELVIKIPEKIYESVMNGAYCGTLYQELKNGTPLPKGHGRLIDADKAKENMMYEMCGTGYQTRAMNVLNEYNAPTIIEADEVKS